jgi:pectate lyase
MGGTAGISSQETTVVGGAPASGGTTNVAGGTKAIGGTTATGGTKATGGTTASVSTSTPTADSGLMGFATVDGFGLPTTTGGKGGRVVVATTLAELTEYMDTDETLIVQVSGSIDLEGNMVALRSNKSLIGLSGAKIHNGGLEMYKRQNIIIRNIVFADGTDDTIKINQNTHHVWVDHCDFTNAADGLFDITRQSSHITISWNHFYTHSKTMLIGHSDAETADTGYLKTTIHHNWFDGTEQRHPRVRFGEVHVLNNYFLNNGLYGVASTMEADVVVEGNYFENVAYPTYCGYAESGPGDLIERDNHFVGSGTPATRGTAFAPAAAYPYAVEPAAGIAASVRDYAGVGKIDPVAASK